MYFKAVTLAFVHMPFTAHSFTCSSSIVSVTRQKIEKGVSAQNTIFFLGLLTTTSMYKLTKRRKQHKEGRTSTKADESLQDQCQTNKRKSPKIKKKKSPAFSLSPWRTKAESPRS